MEVGRVRDDACDTNVEVWKVGEQSLSEFGRVCETVHVDLCRDDEVGRGRGHASHARDGRAVVNHHARSIGREGGKRTL